MMSLRIHLSLTTQIPPFPTLKKPHLSNTLFPNIPPHPIITHNSSTINRRNHNFSIIALFLSLSIPHHALADEDEQEKMAVLEKYTDYNQGFTLLVPSSYLKVDKAGATVLFEEVNKGSNNIGVVVTPVRLARLTDFGTPQFVADKLIQAEKRKESTNDAEVIGVSERLGVGGLPVYEFEYIVDSSRGGMKRIFSAAFVTGKKLYLLNISHADKPDSPLGSQTRMMLEQVLHSFDAAAPLT